MKKIVYLLLLLLGYWHTSFAQIKATEGVRLVVSGGVHVVATGNVAVDATSTVTAAPTSTITLNGAAQNLNFGNGTTLGKVVLAGNAPKNLQNSLTIATDLTFNGINANLLLGTNNVTFGATTTVTGASQTKGYVVTNGSGKYQQSYATPINKIFQLGDALKYSPLTLEMTSANLAANSLLSVHVATGRYPAADVTNYLNRYWAISTTDITNLQGTLSGEFATGEVMGSSPKAAYYDGTSWTYGTTINTSPTPTLSLNSFATSGVFSGTFTAPCTMYVRMDGNDTNTGYGNTDITAKRTLQAAIDVIADGCTIVLNSGTYNETATLTNKSITLQSIGNPTVQNLIVNGVGKTLTLTGNIIVSELVSLQAGDIAANGNLTLLATSSKQAMLLQRANTNITGNVTVQRYLQSNTAFGGTTGRGYRFLSSPTSNATLNELSELNPIVNPLFNTSATPGKVTPFPTIYNYDATKAGDPSKNFAASPFPDFDKGWVSPSALTDAMTVGKGFTVNAAANQVVSITGTLNNGSLSIPIVTGNAASLGYNLVGNPYPSPISWAAVRALSTGVNDAIYQHMATGQYTGGWGSYINGVGTNGATDNIAIMQGFFVRANAGGSINFDNSVRATAYINPASFREEDNKTTPKTNGLVRLALTNTGNKTDETVVYFTEKATQDFDNQYDAVKFQLNGGALPNLYTTSKNALYSINGLPTLTDDLVVPITVQSWNGGKHKVALTEKVNFSREVQVFLRDKTSNTLHDFSKGAFEFSANAGVLSDRFELVFSPQLTQAEANGDNLAIYPNPTVETATISVGDDYKGELSIRLTDVSGREVWTSKAQKTSKIYETPVNLSGLASGVYFLEVQGKTKTVKKVVKQ